MRDGLAKLKSLELLLGKARTPGFCFDRTRYFYTALSEQSGVSLKIRPLSAALFAFLRLKNIRGAYKFWRKWASKSGSKEFPETTNHIAQYIFRFENGSVRVAIDIADGRNLHNQEVVDWSEVYFKCNAWPSIDYPHKVLPLVNGNGSLSEEKINRLVNLRKIPKAYDLVYWSRVWAAPGNDPDNNGVEHNIRLFEALAKVKGNKNLLAVFPESMDDTGLQAYRDRLDTAGVLWQRGWGNINSKILWENLANARVNFLRPGNHLCISWRMMDLLAMGACIMVDGVPCPQWPVRLEDNINYVNADCTLTENYQLPDEKDYVRMTHLITELIEDTEKTKTIAENNARYFDESADLKPVSNYIIREVSRVYSEKYGLT